MEQNKQIFSKSISTGTRVYYFDVCADGKDQKYMSISEIPTDKSPKKKRRQRIFIHSQNIEKFVAALGEATNFITGNAER